MIELQSSEKNNMVRTRLQAVVISRSSSAPVPTHHRLHDCFPTPGRNIISSTIPPAPPTHRDMTEFWDGYSSTRVKLLLARRQRTKGTAAAATGAAAAAAAGSPARARIADGSAQGRTRGRTPLTHSLAPLIATQLGAHFHFPFFCSTPGNDATRRGAAWSAPPISAGHARRKARQQRSARTAGRQAGRLGTREQGNGGKVAPSRPPVSLCLAS